MFVALCILFDENSVNNSTVSIAISMYPPPVSDYYLERYTETERSQHILHKDPRIFGTSYVAFVSSCDGFAAFMREKPDHTVVDYFQGFRQFWQPGLPTELPAALKMKVLENPEVIECDRRMREAVDEPARERAKKDRQNAIKRVKKKELEQHRTESMGLKQRERLLHGVSSTLGNDPDPLNELIPEKGRVARAMTDDSPLSCDEQLKSMRDVLFLLKNDWSVYYRPGEELQSGACRFCKKEVGW